jgi:hypothetical protein
MKRKAWCGSASLLIIALGSGCRMAETIRENTEEIRATSRVIARNTTTIDASTQTTQNLESALQQVSSLKEPMQDVAALGPTFNKVADLEGPMQELAGLRDPMVQLAALKSSLDRVAVLGPTFNKVADLTPGQLAASVIAVILVFFGLQFVTVWGAVRLGSRHRPA